MGSIGIIYILGLYELKSKLLKGDLRVLRTWVSFGILSEVEV